MTSEVRKKILVLLRDLRGRFETDIEEMEEIVDEINKTEELFAASDDKNPPNDH